MTTICCSKLFPHTGDAAYIWAPWYRRLRIVLPLLAVVITMTLLLSGGVATYPIGTARLLMAFGTPILQNANMEGVSLSDPQELIDLNGEGVSVYLKYANDYITYLESDFHP